ncbi:hypothetical protein V1502_05210 [Bacillus sp. SCS-153A]|uniref:hypothetical protein n=1 Tax=Rossellomorea sedimentorum TaxID=3115294 RepID=UPI0039065E5A
MKLFKSAVCTLLFVLILSGCGANTVQEVLESDIFKLEVLNETDTKYGNVVFYKTVSPSEIYGARLLKKNGSEWEILLGSRISAIEKSQDISWAWQSSSDSPTFFYGIIKNNAIRKLTVNGTDAVIVNLENDYNLFYLLTNEEALDIQENGEKGTQIKGFTDEGNLIYQRMTFN